MTAFATRVASTDSLSSTLATEKQKHDYSKPEAVDSDPYPDMLVLGFQELDLSAEALLYSTNTLREDAWCLAIFAALGEKAVIYDKVGRVLSSPSSYCLVNMQPS